MASARVQEPHGPEYHEKAARAYEEATRQMPKIVESTSPVAQVASSVAHKAVGAAAQEVLDESMKKIGDGLQQLKTLNEQGKGDTEEARKLENNINAEARHAGSIMEVFKKDLPEEYSLSALNKMIENGAMQVYGEAGHVTYHDISAVHDVKEHIRNEVHDVKNMGLSADDVGSILQRVEAKIGDALVASLSAMKVDKDEIDNMLLKIALSSAERDYREGLSESTGPAEVGQLKHSTGSGSLSSEQIDKINQNLASFSAAAAGKKTKTENINNAKSALEWVAGSGIMGASAAEISAHYVSAASSFAAAGDHKKAGKYLSKAAENLSDSDPAAAGELHEKSGDAYREGGSLRKAVKEYEKASSVAKKLSEGVTDSARAVKAATAEADKAGILSKRKAVHALEKAAQIAEGEQKAGIQEKIGDLYDSMKLGRDKTALHYYTEAISNTSSDELKEKIREKIRKIEGEEGQRNAAPQPGAPAA